MVSVAVIDPDPVGYYGTDLANALADCGLSVRLITARGYPHRGIAKVPVVEVAPESSNGRIAKKVLQEAAFLVHVGLEVTVRRSLLHVQWLRTPAEAEFYRALHAAGSSVVFTAHNAGPRKGAEWADGSYRTMYRVSDRIIAHSEATKREVIERYGVDHNRIAVVPHGMHVAGETRINGCEDLRRSLGIGAGDVLLAHLGQIRAYKGYERLLTAFDVAASSCSTLHLAIVGRATAQMCGHVQSLVNTMRPACRRRVHLNVELNRFLSEETMAEYYGAADCLVLPYVEISQSGVLMTGRGYGKAVIAARVGALGEVIRDGIDGWTYPESETHALTELFRLAAASRARLREMGENGRDWAQESFGWISVARRTISVYEGALEARAG